MTDGRGWKWENDTNTMEPIHAAGHAKPATIANKEFIPEYSFIPSDTGFSVLFTLNGTTDGHVSLLDYRGGEPLGASWAFGPEEHMAYHLPDNRGQIIVDLASGKIIPCPDPDYLSFYAVPLVSGALAIAGWALLVNIKSFRESSMYYYLTGHRFFSQPLRIPYVDAFTFDVRLTVSDLAFVDWMLIAGYAIVTVSFIVMGANSYNQFPKRGWQMIFGHLLVWHLPLVYLPVTKHSLWLRLFRLPFERAIRYHRWLARLTVGWALVHLLTELNFYTKKILFYEVGYHLERGSIYGFFAFLVMCAMAVVAIPFIRKHAFEMFWYFHLMGLVAVAVLSCIHSKPILIGFICVFGLYAIDKCYRLYQCYSSSHPVLSMELIHSPGHPGKVVKIEFQPSSSFHFEAGQYLFINIPAVSLNEYHPFSISSSPKSGVLTCCVASQGPATWTGRLAALAASHANNAGAGGAINGGGGGSRVLSLNSANDELQMNLLSSGGFANAARPLPGLSVRLHGPYGLIGFDYFHCRSLLLVAGGVGATPWLSVLGSLVEYFHDNPNAKLEHVHFLWTARSPAYFQLLDDLAPLLAQEKRIHVHLFCSQAAPSAVGGSAASRGSTNGLGGPNFPVHAGRLNIASEIHDLLIHARLATDPLAVGVLACGPEALVVDAQNIAQENKWKFHKEIFEF